MSDKGGRPTTLTKELAEQLEVLWQLSGDDTLTDKEIAARLGITFKKLTGWLDRNTKAFVKIDKESGKRVKLPDGLRVIRTRAKATTKSSYLQTHYSLMKAAEAAGDFRTALTAVDWLLEKQFPNEFGNRLKLSGKVEQGKDTEDMSDEELEEHMREDLAELLKRPECRIIAKELLSALTD